MSLQDRISFLKEVWHGYQKDNGSLLAGSISFYGFLSFFPTLLAAVGVLGFVLGSPENAEAAISRTISHFIVGDQARAITEELIKGRSAATGIGLALLLWSGMSAVVVLEKALNLAWSAGEQRGFIKTRLLALATLIITGALLLVSFGATAALRTVRSMAPAAVAGFSPIWTVLGYFVPIFLSIAPFVLVYKLLPVARVSWGTALVAGTLAGLFWEIAKQVFTYYVLNWASYNKVYGSLASVILLMIWIYYSAIITVLGAEFGATWALRRQRV